MRALELFKYNVRLGVKNIRRNPVLSGLMVGAIAIGIGASMAMVTVNYRFGSNPIPEKSDVLHYIRLDNWNPDFPFQMGDGPTVPNQVTYLDATALLAAKRAYRQAAMSVTTLAVEPEERDERPYFISVRATTADFFPMFNVPFKYGNAWSADVDDAAEQVVVLKATTNERIFGGENSVGRMVRLSGADYRVVGVLDRWEPLPRFYDSGGDPAAEIEEAFIPWRLVTAKQLPRTGNTNCWKPAPGDGFQAFLNSECIWIQFWTELRSGSEREDYLGFLNAYVAEQKKLGRFPRPLDNRVTPLMQWLEERGIVPDEAQVLLGLSLIFLVVCLLNTIGLLLAKFLGKAPEIGIRRALGASRRVLFQQYLVEAGLIGVAGGVLGLGFTWLALQGIRTQFSEDNINRILLMDWTLVFMAVAVAMFASIVTAIYPTWRACNVQPATYLSAH
jgi:putative ABC transport system permease protein